MKGKLLRVFLILFLACIVSIGFLLYTETGLKWLLSRVTYLIPGEITVEAVHGRLIGPAEVKGLRYQSTDYTIDFERFSFDWHPLSLVGGAIDIVNFYGEGVDVLRLTSPKKQAADTFLFPHRISLPFQVIIHDLIVKRIVFSSKGSERNISIDELLLKARAERDAIQIDTLTVTAPTFTVTAVGGFKPYGEPPVDFSLNWAADVSENKHLKGTGKILGNEKRLTLSHEVDGPVESNFTVVLNNLFEDTVPIELLDITTPLFNVKGDGILKPQGKYLIDVFVNWRAHILDYPQLTGKGNFLGNATQLKLTQQLDGPFKAKISAVMNNLFKDMFWDADVDIADLNPIKLRATWPETSLKAQVHGSGNLTSFNSRGTFHAAYPVLKNVEGAFHIEYVPEKFLLRNVDMTIADSNIKLTAQGEWMTRDKQRGIKMHGNWQRFSWPLEGKALMRSPEGNFAVTGSLQDYELQFEGLFTGENIPEGYWTAVGRGSPGVLKLNKVRGKLLDSVLEGDGTLKWRPHPYWQVALRGKALNPGKKWQAWPGTLDVHAVTQGTIKEGVHQGKLDVKHLTGVLRGFDFSARTSVEVNNDQVTLSNLEVKSGSSQLSASGYLKNEWGVAWEVNAPDMGTLLPASSGSLKAEGRVSGPRSAPRIVASIHGENMMIQANQAARLDASLDVDFHTKQDLHLDLDVNGLQFEKQTVDNVSIQGSGKADNHHLQVHVASGQDTLDLRIDGQFKDDLWHGLLNKADIKSITLGHWNLENQGTISASLHHIQVEELCFVDQEARLCWGTTWRPKEMWDVSIAAENLSFTTFQTFLPPELNLTGTISGKAAAHTDPGDGMNAAFDFHAPLGTINVPVMQGKVKTISYEMGLLKGKIDESGLDGRASLSLPNEGIMNIAISLPEFNTTTRFSREQSVQGECQVDLKDLDLLAGLLQDVENAKGVLSMNFIVGGQLARPILTGRLSLEEGAAHVPRLGVVLKKVHLNAVSEDGEGIQFTGGAASGKGDLHFSGQTRIDSIKQWEIQVKVEGEQFEAINLPEAVVLISPILEIKFQGDRLDVVGETTIPEATIKPRDLTRAVKVSQDVVFVDETGKVSKKTINIYSQVKITFGEKVRFEGFGLNGRFTGHLLVVDEPEKLTTGQGELEIVDATYEIYNKKLSLERGKLIFLGNIIEDPFVDIEAVQKVGDVTVGVKVRDTLRKPGLTLFSEPPMPQTDILSYLILGRPLNQVSGEEGRTLVNVASLMGLGGGNQLAKQIGGMFGLEEVKFESGSEPEDTTLIIGKYLSPRLYINYGIGLFQPISTLRIRYQLGSRWFLQSETGVEKGADLIYTIER